MASPASSSPGEQQGLLRLRAEVEAKIEDSKARGRALLEHRKAYTTLGVELQRVGERSSLPVMVPLTSKAFMQGELVHTNELMVLLGENYFIESSGKQAKEICDRRIAQCDKMLLDIEKEIKLIDGWRQEASRYRQEEEDAVDIKEEYNEEQEKEWKQQHKKRLKEEREREGRREVTEDETEAVWRRLEELEVREALEEEWSKQEEMEEGEKQEENEVGEQHKNQEGIQQEPDLNLDTVASEGVTELNYGPLESVLGNSSSSSSSNSPSTGEAVPDMATSASTGEAVPDTTTSPSTGEAAVPDTAGDESPPPPHRDAETPERRRISWGRLEQSQSPPPLYEEDDTPEAAVDPDDQPSEQRRRRRRIFFVHSDNPSEPSAAIMNESPSPSTMLSLSPVGAISTNTQAAATSCRPSPPLLPPGGGTVAPLPPQNPADLVRLVRFEPKSILKKSSKFKSTSIDSLSLDSGRRSLYASAGFKAGVGTASAAATGSGAGDGSGGTGSLAPMPRVRANTLETYSRNETDYSPVYIREPAPTAVSASVREKTDPAGGPEPEQPEQPVVRRVSRFRTMRLKE